MVLIFSNKLIKMKMYVMFYLIHAQVSPVVRWYSAIGKRTEASTTSVACAAALENVNYTTTLLSGSVGLLSRSSMPLYALNGYINIEDIEFHASFIHCKEQVMQQTTMPILYTLVLNIHGQLQHNNSFFLLNMGV